MDDELENFIRERKARVAEDKARLEQDPPYMEMMAKPHRSYESTVKENIPPNSVAQGKEESCSVGLPLGVEYERKKQRLQHELRMDYRRYMAQKKHFDSGPFIHLDNRRSVKQYLLEDQTGVVPRQRVSLRRDAATLTEENKGLQRVLHLAEVKTLCPEEEDEQPPLARRYRNRPRRPVDQESEEDEYSEELELMDGRTTDAGYERRRTNKTDGREKRENPVGFARDGRRFKAPTKIDDTEFATGLLIGADDTDETLRRRKERYRQELQEQIAEQHRNKKREKDLELKVAATGANDPEKQPDRIRQFGLSRRRNLQVLQPSAAGECESSSRGLSNRERIGLREREMPPPEQPHVAFQSPLLDYSSALGLGGGLSPNGQPSAPSFHRATDTPRIPMFPPHPPSGLSDAYRSLYTEPHFCYGSRNLLDPNMAYCGHLSVPGAGLPVSCWNIPQGGAVPSQFGNHSPHSQYSGSSFPDPPTRSRNEAPAVNSPIRVFPAERSSSSRERILSYRDALKEQIQEQQERRRLEKEERERYEARLEADMKNHQPWGRGGGGAPLKDSTGNLIADLNQMHKLNEEAYINPEQWQRKATAAMTARQPEQPDPNERVSGFTHVQTPQFARGKVFSNQPSQQQLQEQDKYKAFLKQQIEEKMRKKAEERERARLEEEKEEKRLAEQRARIQREFEEEQERKKQKEKEQNVKNEELIQQAEDRKKEAERKKKDVEEKERERRQYERERQARVEEVCREPSPPIPTLQKKHVPHQFTPRPPTVDSQHSTVPLSERSLSGLQSPPVPARRTQLRAACDQRDVFGELSALRRQLRSEQKRLESHLQQDDWEELDSPLSDRLGERPPVDVFDMARLRLQAPVRRPNSRNMEPRNLLRIHDSLQLKYTDAKSRLDSTEVPRLDEVGVTSRRRHDYRETHHQLSSHGSTAQDDYLDLSPTHQNEYLRSAMGRSARGSLLDSESAFIDPLGNAFPVPRSPECEKSPQLSARERRRLAKQSQHPQEGAASSQCKGQHDSNTGPVDLSDDDSYPPRFSLHNMNRQSSRESAVTDSWTRPGTSDTQKRLDRPSRRERLAT